MLSIWGRRGTGRTGRPNRDTPLLHAGCRTTPLETVKYRIEGEEKIRERDVVIRVRSRDVVARPKIISLERAASPDGSVVLRGNVTLYNVPESFRPKPLISWFAPGWMLVTLSVR